VSGRRSGNSVSSAYRAKADIMALAGSFPSQSADFSEPRRACTDRIGKIGWGKMTIVLFHHRVSECPRFLATIRRGTPFIVARLAQVWRNATVKLGRLGDVARYASSLNRCRHLPIERVGLKPIPRKCYTFAYERIAKGSLSSRRLGFGSGLALSFRLRLTLDDWALGGRICAGRCSDVVR
jgi:hypothetical protein